MIARMLALLFCVFSPLVSGEDDWEPLQMNQVLEGFIQGAHHDDPVAQYLLSLMYMQGAGVHEDVGEGLRWLSAAAENGLPDAMFQLGRGLVVGAYGNRNEAEGLALLTVTADEGHLPACVFLGWYLMGLGSGSYAAPRDTQRAKEYLLRAAEGGAIGAYFLLGQMYRGGLEPEADLDADLDFKRAAHWFELAAKSGHILAMVALAEIYLQPNFGLFDPQEGYFLLKTASLTGWTESDADLSRTAASLDPDVTAMLDAKAEELVESFQEGIE